VRHAHAPAICAAGVSRRLAAVRRPLADPADDGSWLRLAAECLVIMGVGTMVLAFAYSKVNSAWAVRYLAAVVGPLTLVFGLGIARARSLGVVGLVLLAGFWILDPVPHSLEHKSNVHAVATHIRPALGSDALVLSTAPEQVAVLDYYLPAVRHWGTPLGPVADPRVVDWRDALTRFERSSVSTVLVPMLRSLTAGERVALVTPVTIPHAPLYMRLIRRATHAWSDYLARDRALRRVGSTDADSHVTSEGLQAVVYVRR
jgi:hypothetical protein